MQWRLWALALATWGCVSEAMQPPTDPEGLEAPAPPDAVARVASDCAAGWAQSELSLGGHTCVPWMDTPRCGDGELLVAGTGCEAIAAHCDVGFASDAPPGAVFVRPSALGGDGTREHPYGTIEAALGAGASVVALSEGTHTFAGGPLDGVTLLGACASTTTLRLRASLVAEGGETRLARMRIRGLVPPETFWSAIVVAAGASARLEELELASGVSRAIEAEAGSTVDARRVAARDTRELFLVAQDPAAIVLDHVSVERATGGALLVGASGLVPFGTIDATDVVVTGTVLGDDPSAAERGTWMIDRLERVVLERIVIDQSAQGGMLCRGGDVRLADVLVRGAHAMGIGLIEGRMEISRATIDGTTGVGLFATEAWLDGRDLVVRDAENPIVLFGGQTTLGRVAVEQALGGAIQCEAGEATLSDVSVDGVVSNRTGGGYGLQVRAGSITRAQRLDVRAASYAAVVTFRASLELDDARVSDTVPVDDVGGYGIVNVGGALHARRLEVVRATTIGAYTIGGESSYTDLAVGDTRAASEQLGVGLTVHGELDTPTSVRVERAAVDGSRLWGVWVTGPAATLSATDLRVDGTATAPCADSTCVGGGGGSNVVVASGASAVIDRFVSSGAASAGALLDEDVGVSLSNGTIALNAIGLALAPGLPVNTEARPGLEHHALTVTRNDVDQQVTSLDLSAQPPVVQIDPN